MGAIMCIGVATANSILIVTFANDERATVESARAAMLSAGYARMRPVIMTATAMILGMLPMALSLGEGGEQNAPLGPRRHWRPAFRHRHYALCRAYHLQLSAHESAGRSRAPSRSSVSARRNCIESLAA